MNWICKNLAISGKVGSVAGQTGLFQAESGKSAMANAKNS